MEPTLHTQRFELVRVMKAVPQRTALPDAIPLRARSMKVGSTHCGNDVRLEHPSLSGVVSRAHATFSRGSKGAWRVRDTNSTNGTFVNGKRLNPFLKHRLRQGDCVTFGDRFILKDDGVEGTEPLYRANCYCYVYQRMVKDFILINT